MVDILFLCFRKLGLLIMIIINTGMIPVFYIYNDRTNIPFTKLSIELDRESFSENNS